MTLLASSRFVVASLLAASAWIPAHADDAASAARSTYAKDRADCNMGKTAEDRATCLKEAGAAQDERRRNRLDNSGSMSQNAVDRCGALSGKEKGDCMARINGAKTCNQQVTTSGSVAGGGVLRESKTTTTTTTMVPATPAPSAPR